jgi:LPXTG-site transpeptidase (sortase) family protein
MQNPLFPTNDSQPPKWPDEGDDHGIDPFDEHHRKAARVEPVGNPAAEFIRQKVERAYGTHKEPDPKEEIAEAEEARPRSKHQQYMHELSTSGMGLADIQVAWHNYYQNLSDAEKHQVWREFYDAHEQDAHAARQAAEPRVVHQQPQPAPQDAGSDHRAAPYVPSYASLGQVPEDNNQYDEPASQPESGVRYGNFESDASNMPSWQQAKETPSWQNYEYPANDQPTWPNREIAHEQFNYPPEKPSAKDNAKNKLKKLQDKTIKKSKKEQYGGAQPEYPEGRDVQPSQLRDHVRRTADTSASGKPKLTAKHHIQSLAFGLGFGALVLFIVLFGFFNQTVIAPFITPARYASATPIIIAPGDISPTKKPEIIIPKINLQIPAIYSATSDNEAEIERHLQNGVVHYPSTELPGQKGNAVFFGHSSNNIFNPGKYKFAFTLLHKLVPGDNFYLTYDHKVYAYQVYKKKIVDPSDVSVLNNLKEHPSSATLITCDPPGTSINRLAVWGEQVSPNPKHNTKPKPTPTESGAEYHLATDGPSPWKSIKTWIANLF